MAVVGLIGTFDTKGLECAWVRSRIEELGVQVLTIDVGPLSTAEADVTAAEVARAAGEDLAALTGLPDRGPAMDAMARGCAAVVTGLAQEGRIDAVFAAGGSGGSSIASQAMRALPVGFPKLLVSTMASGDTSAIVGESDLTLMYSVVDVAGINSVSSQVFANGAAAVAGMALDYARRRASTRQDGRPVVAITMFGLTTPAADEARAVLHGLGYETLVFHATGSGGRAMEKLARDGALAGVLDLTTTELADDLVGGVLSAGPRRLEAAGEQGLPQVVSLGALDMVNFGPQDSVPHDFDGRSFVVHNPVVTLMRTLPAENRELGARIARKLAAATGPTALIVPRGGVSGLDEPGRPFWDPEADTALFDAVTEGLSGTPVTVVDSDLHINATGFGAAAAELLDSLIRPGAERP